MSNIIALNAVTAGATNPAAALDSITISPDALAVVSEIAANTGLSASERGSLIQTTAAIDQFVTAQPDRAGALSQVSGLGVYLRQTSSASWPRWSVLTALRSYGLNLTETQRVDPAPTQEQAVQHVRQQLETVARASRDVSLDTAIAVTRAVAPVVQQAPAPAPRAAAPKAETSAPSSEGHSVVKFV